MRKNIEKVIAAFKRGIPAKGDSKATCWTDGDTIYSYALPIARRVPRGREEIEIREDYPTATTRSQIDALRRTFPDAIPVEEVPHPVAICGVCTYGHGTPGDLCERHGKRIPTPNVPDRRPEWEL